MAASMFQMGFNSGSFQPLPVNLGISLKDLRTDWQNIYGQVKDIRNTFQAPAGTVPLVPPVPVVRPESTILGLPSSTVMIGGALVLGAGVLAAVLLSRG